MKTVETALIDTNIILYAIDSDSQFHSSAKRLCEKGLRGEISICITPQIVSEFLATATNPKRFLNPISLQDAIVEISHFIHSSCVSKIYQNSSVYSKLIELVQQYHIRKQEIHDALLAATMITNGINRIYTLNQKDFEVYLEIEVITP